jgi:DNA repair exonuclease SbcCD ATPase subunit
VDHEEIDELRSRVEQLHERIAVIDLRVTSIATELANQINELSGEVETLGSREPATVSEVPLDDGDATEVVEAVTELRDAQVRLATEQARYQIAFRQELADLAERLRRA